MNIETIDQACKEAGVPLSNEQRCVIIGVLNGSAARYTISAGTIEPNPTAVKMGENMGRVLCEDVERAILRAAKESGETIHKGKLVTEQDDGWIEWKGGECPVAPDTEVMVRLRGESEPNRPVKARWMHWTHTDPCVTPIIAYKVIG